MKFVSVSIGLKYLYIFLKKQIDDYSGLTRECKQLQVWDDSINKYVQNNLIIFPLDSCAITPIFQPETGISLFPYVKGVYP